MESTDRKKSQEGSTILTHSKEKSGSCRSAVLHPVPHSLERVRAGRHARIPSALTEMLQSAGSLTVEHVRRLFQIAPKLASLHCSRPTQTALFQQAEPAAFCSARLCPVHPIASQLDFALPFQPEQNFSSGWYHSVVSAMTLLVYYARGVHTGSCKKGLRAAGTSPAFVLRW